MTWAAIDLGFQFLHFTTVKFYLEVFVVDVATRQIAGPPLPLLLIFIYNGFLLRFKLIDHLLTFGFLELYFHNLIGLLLNFVLLVRTEIFQDIELSDEVLLLHSEAVVLWSEEGLNLLPLTLQLYWLLIFFLLDLAEAFQ